MVVDGVTSCLVSIPKWNYRRRRRAYCLLFRHHVSLRANFGWRHVIGQVLFNIEENRRVVSAPANDCIAFPQTGHRVVLVRYGAPGVDHPRRGP
jgi:hypothetical protein